MSQEPSRTVNESSNTTPPTDGGDNVNELPTAEEQAQILFGSKGKFSWTIPRDAQQDFDVLGHEILIIFCEGVGIDYRTLPKKRVRSWTRKLLQTLTPWQASDEEGIRALKALFTSEEFSWKSYSSPYQDGFVADFELYIGRGRTTQHRAARVLPGLEG